MPSSQPTGQADLTSSGEKAVLCKALGFPEDSFPVLDKSLVQGDEAVPFFAWLTSQTPLRGGDSGPISGNFNKFLIDSDGKLVKRYSNFDKEWNPFDEESALMESVGPEIERLLDQ